MIRAVLTGWWNWKILFFNISSTSINDRNVGKNFFNKKNIKNHARDYSPPKIIILQKKKNETRISDKYSGEKLIISRSKAKCKNHGDERYNDNRKIGGSRIFLPLMSPKDESIDTRIQEVQMMTIYKRGDKASWWRVRRSAHEPCHASRLQRGVGGVSKRDYVGLARPEENGCLISVHRDWLPFYPFNRSNEFLW